MAHEELKRQAEELVAEYKERLRLQAWEIRVIIDDTLECCAARINRSYYGFADLRIVSQTADAWGCSLGLEVRIVHELLHCHGLLFDFKLKDGSAEDKAHEWMIETSARAIVEAKYGKKLAWGTRE